MIAALRRWLTPADHDWRPSFLFIAYRSIEGHWISGPAMKQRVGGVASYRPETDEELCARILRDAW